MPGFARPDTGEGDLGDTGGDLGDTAGCQAAREVLLEGGCWLPAGWLPAPWRRCGSPGLQGVMLQPSGSVR